MKKKYITKYNSFMCDENNIPEDLYSKIAEKYQIFWAKSGVTIGKGDITINHRTKFDDKTGGEAQQFGWHPLDGTEYLYLLDARGLEKRIKKF